MAKTFDMIAKTFFGLEEVLAEELTSLGAAEVQAGRRMCSFHGDTALLYRTNIHLRTAVRILKPIASFATTDEQTLYDGVARIDWREHLDADASLAIDPVVHNSAFSNSLYVAQLAKDAIVDQLRTARGARPRVDLSDPDLRLNLHVSGQQATVYLDASGDSLHKRGYRAETGEAPINEVLAAGILALTGWDARSPLVDFMCGSGTFLIEGALRARRIAPGLIRRQFGYMRWKDFQSAIHQRELAAAERAVLPKPDFPLQGSDLDGRVIAAARENAQRAGVQGDIQWLVESFEKVAPPAPNGTLISNPPYDERMKAQSIAAVYRRIGDVLKRRWAPYTAFIFTGNLEAGKQIGLRPSGRTRLRNGPIECRLLKFELTPLAASNEPQTGQAAASSTGRDEQQVVDFANRLQRMARHWQRWAARLHLTAYRVYDRDIPDVPLAIDRYDKYVLVSEYERPHSRTEIEHQAWLERMLKTIAETLEVRPSQIIPPVASRPSGKRGTSPQPQVVMVSEGPLEFETRLGPTGSTGLELHERQLRGMIYQASEQKRALSLWARTGTMAVAAGAGGAESTLSVEGSRNLVAWARRNLELNALDGRQHRVICEDPLAFVAGLNPAETTFDLIVAAPPGFDGRRREGVWNVQDGHVDLLAKLLACLSPDGSIYFVTTFRRLKLHEAQLPGAYLREITARSVPPDIRDRKAHRAWLIRHRREAK